MNANLAVHNIAFAQAATLPEAQMLIARRANDLVVQLAELRAETDEDASSNGAGNVMTKAISRIEYEAAQAAPDETHPPPEPGLGAVVDRLA